ncbi:hypothetical protein [Sulfurimonas sp. C5]|uniref:hypothetical protein n=1 Tax=Sulfurimonas sp. C5 TaxID=3036947 RepID=UPI0024549F79|nr:hypothetical protein [Sulfurimonas sp. C5]MDH4944734.1 hypothetical protein [Sulfurimonas sp. C5]
MLKNLLVAAFAMLFIGCTGNVIVTTPEQLPNVQGEQNATEQKDGMTISLFRLENYTDTPRAGMRAGNILEGILKAKGYTIISHVNDASYSFAKAAKTAQDDRATYFLYGGVSEWRYKTGIDGEPAVSIQLSLYNTKTQELVWSATGSDSDWGNGSIGTTAQDLLMEMVEK